MFTFVNDLHPLKDEGPIEVTDEGISMVFNEVQSSNALSSILVTELGISICVISENS